MTAAEFFNGKLIMAPMSRGTDLPFRRLVNEWGAPICVGEMAYAHKLIGRHYSDRFLLRRHPSERCFGVQLAGKRANVMAEAAQVAEQAGADFVDINLGCPIDDTTRRGFGAALLRRPGRVAEIIRAMKAAVSVPVTLKLRLGWSSEKPTFMKIAIAAQDAGVDAITLHPRSRAQRYRRAADWTHVQELSETVNVPIIGNGDILTWQDARQRLAEGSCTAVMVGRWALAKPWIFKEFEVQRDFVPDADERLSILRRYVELCFEHFRDDEKGRQRTRRFLGFHQDFFRRYRRGAGIDAVNSSDPRNWGADPEGDLESWLCRGDVDAVDALCDWLVDGKPQQFPGPAQPDAPRAFKVHANG